MLTAGGVYSEGELEGIRRGQAPRWRGPRANGVRISSRFYSHTNCLALTDPPPSHDANTGRSSWPVSTPPRTRSHGSCTFSVRTRTCKGSSAPSSGRLKSSTAGRSRTTSCAHCRILTRSVASRSVCEPLLPFLSLSRLTDSCDATSYAPVNINGRE